VGIYKWRYIDINGYSNMIRLGRKISHLLDGDRRSIKE